MSALSPLERIVAECGGILLDGGARALIPGPNHSPKDRSVSLRLTEEGRILIHCFSPKDDWREVRRVLAERGLIDDEEPPSGAPRRAAPEIVAHPEDEERLARALRIWRESRPIGHTIAEAYLRRRAISAEVSATPALRFHASVTSLDDRLRRPALLAAITDAEGALQGVQVTLLSAQGAAKADVATPRRVIGKLMGGTVRLHEGEGPLAIGEGVETMLSASEGLGLPAWAALSAQNLAKFQPPAGVSRLIVAVDADPAGHAALEALRVRLGRALEVEAAFPPDAAPDWNAWAMSRRR